MINGNDLLTPEARKCIDRIRVLRTLSQRTGFSTTEEQFRLLLSLSNEDALAASDALARDPKPALQSSFRGSR